MQRIACLSAILWMVAANGGLADDLPSPGAVGTGSSNESIGLVGGTVEITVESSGALSTGDIHAASGQLGLGVSVSEPSPDLGTRPQDFPTDETINSPTPAGTFMQVQGATADRDAACSSTTMTSLDAKKIAALAPEGLDLVEVCNPGEMSATQRDAVVGNHSLSAWLSTKGYSIADLSGLALSADESALIVSRAYASPN